MSISIKYTTKKADLIIISSSPQVLEPEFAKILLPSRGDGYSYAVVKIQLGVVVFRHMMQVDDKRFVDSIEICILKRVLPEVERLAGDICPVERVQHGFAVLYIDIQYVVGADFFMRAV